MLALLVRWLVGWLVGTQEEAQRRITSMRSDLVEALNAAVDSTVASIVEADGTSGASTSDDDDAATTQGSGPAATTPAAAGGGGGGGGGGGSKASLMNDDDLQRVSMSDLMLMDPTAMFSEVTKALTPVGAAGRQRNNNVRPFIRVLACSLVRSSDCAFGCSYAHT